MKRGTDTIAGVALTCGRNCLVVSDDDAVLRGIVGWRELRDWLLVVVSFEQPELRASGRRYFAKVIMHHRHLRRFQNNRFRFGGVY